MTWATAISSRSARPRPKHQRLITLSLNGAELSVLLLAASAKTPTGTVTSAWTYEAGLAIYESRAGEYRMLSSLKTE